MRPTGFIARRCTAARDGHPRPGRARRAAYARRARRWGRVACEAEPLPERSGVLSRREWPGAGPTRHVQSGLPNASLSAARDQVARRPPHPGGRRAGAPVSRRRAGPNYPAIAATRGQAGRRLTGVRLDASWHREAPPARALEDDARRRKARDCVHGAPEARRRRDSAHLGNIEVACADGRRPIRSATPSRSRAPGLTPSRRPRRGAMAPLCFLHVPGHTEETCPRPYDAHAPSV